MPAIRVATPHGKGLNRNKVVGHEECEMLNKCRPSARIMAGGGPASMG